MFVLFLLLPRLKYHGTKRHTGLALSSILGRKYKREISTIAYLFPYSTKVEQDMKSILISKAIVELLTV